jgi:hypothetical protein
MEKREYRSEHAICDAFLAVAIGTGLAYVMQMWWFA